MTFFAARAAIPLRSALQRGGPPRFPTSLVAWLQALLAEARRAAEAEHRYMQLQYQDPAALALQGSAHKNAARQVFEEFYADPPASVLA